MKRCKYCGAVIEEEPKEPTRYVVEATWSGYHSGQARVCHRVIFKAAFKKTLEAYRNLDYVRFTDNTSMAITVRPLLPREKVSEIHGYDSLLDKIIRKGLTGSVGVDQVD